jgi:antitoxin component of RelBE/YafQ-DinJ toxin-antitoxin module
MMKPGWAVRTRLDKLIRLRLPGIVLAELYQIKSQTGLSVSEVVRLLLEYTLSNEESLRKIFEPYKNYHQQKLKEQKDWLRV